MAEYIKFRMHAAKAGVTLAFFTLLAGLADKARAATPRSHTASSAAVIPGVGSLLKIDKVFVKIETSIKKLEQKLATEYLTAHKVNDTFLKIKKADLNYLKIKDANLNFLKVRDASSQYLKIDGTAGNAQKLGNLAPNAFVQGNNTSVVSGALNNLTDTSQQLLSLPGGIIVVSLAHPAGGEIAITIHNGTSTDLVGAVDMGDGSVSRALNLKPNADTTLPTVQDSTADIRVQIFPGGTFTNVVSILIGLTPNPSTNQTEAVAQAFTGGV